MNNVEILMTDTNHSKHRQAPLKSSVEACLKMYFDNLNGEKVNNLYKMVIEETESALFKSVLEHTEGNQSKAAEYLGITRGTLRKRIKQYKLSDCK